MSIAESVFSLTKC